MSIDGVSFVDDFTTVVQKLLAKARVLKPDGAIEPALTLRDLREEVEDLEHRLPGATSRKYAGIETACRNIFYALLVRPLDRMKRFTECHRHQHQLRSNHLVKSGTFSTFYPFCQI